MRFEKTTKFNVGPEAGLATSCGRPSDDRHGQQQLSLYADWAMRSVVGFFGDEYIFGNEFYDTVVNFARRTFRSSRSSDDSRVVEMLSHIPYYVKFARFSRFARSSRSSRCGNAPTHFLLLCLRARTIALAAKYRSHSHCLAARSF